VQKEIDMKITKAWIPLTGAALALAFLGGIALAPALVSTAAAQRAGPTNVVGENRGPGGADLFKAAADFIGITVDQLRTEMGTDKSMADVAVAHGKTRDALIAALTTAEATKIAQLVDQKGFPQPPFGPGGPGGPGFGHRAEVFIRSNVLETASTYLGISTTDLQTKLRSGQTLADIAAATSGKSKDGLVAAIVAAETAQIDKAVTDGKLTADQAATLKAGLTERVTQMVEHKGPMGAPGFGPRGGRP
jgi:hypothetical protein